VTSLFIEIPKSSAYNHLLLLRALGLPNSNRLIPKTNVPLTTYRLSIFELVREQYQARDRLKLIVEYRRKFLDTLLAEGDEQAEQVANAYREARAESDTNYDKASAAAASQRILSEEDQDALNLLWRKLVKLFHPARFASEPEKKAAFERLTAAINQARDEGNIELLREIADDPNTFILRQGWGALDLTEEVEIKALHKLYASLQLEILNLLEC
jgi:hypothetical protein